VIPIRAAWTTTSVRLTAPGLGLSLMPAMKARSSFDETAVYSCMLHDCGPPPDDRWRT